MTDELYHHGIKGMKWGVRRYQNPDGTLTEAGKKRSEREARKAVKKDREWANKNRSLLSDEELNARINRLQREKQLRELTASEINPGRNAAKKILDKYSNTFMQAFVQKVANQTADAVLGNGADASAKALNASAKAFNDGRAWVEWILR